MSPRAPLATIPSAGRLFRSLCLTAVAGLALALPIGNLLAHDETPTAGDHAAHEAEAGHAAVVAPTAAEQAAADRLLRAVRGGVARFADADVAAAEGFAAATSYAFHGLRAAHFSNPRFAQDGVALDPERPETLMYLKRDDGSLELIGVMFVASPGEGPRPAGPLTSWHTHPDLCGAQAGLVTKHADGACPTGTFSLDVEMLHVWLIEKPGGPFADSPVAETVAPLVGVGDAHNSIVAGIGAAEIEALTRDVADLLGLAPADVERRYAAGENLLDIAADARIERSALTDLVTRRTVALLDAAVVRGDATDAQRDLTLRHLAPQIDRMLEIRVDEAWVRDTTH